MTHRLIEQLQNKIDALELAHHAGDDRAFDAITRQIRELLAGAWLHG